MCKSVMRKVNSLTSRERSELYGQSILFVGVLEGEDLLSADTNGFSDPYLTLVLLSDVDGKELEEEKYYSRTHEKTLNPKFDEMFVFGQKTELSEAATLLIKVKDYDTPIKSDHLGIINLPMEIIRQDADINSNPNGVFDLWVDIEPIPGLLASTTGRLHLLLSYHAPVPDPQPLSLAVRIIEATNLVSADSNGFSDPYVKCKVITRTGKDIKTEQGKVGEVKTTIQKVTLNPTWNEIFIFNDLSLGTVGDMEGGWKYPWGWKGGVPPHLLDYSLNQLSVDLSHAGTLSLVLRDYDFGKSDDQLGQVTIPFASLFGDEDAVVCGNTLRLDKWFRVKLSPGMDSKLEGRLGKIHVDIVARFDDDLLPSGWIEGVDSVSGESYWYNTKSKRSQWIPPADVLRIRARTLGGIAEDEDETVDDNDTSSSTNSSSNGSNISFDTLPGDKAHKPPKPNAEPNFADSPRKRGLHSVPTSPHESNTGRRSSTVKETKESENTAEDEEESKETDTPVVTAPKTVSSVVSQGSSTPASKPKPVPVKVDESKDEENDNSNDNNGDDEDNLPEGASAEAIEAVANSTGGKVKDTLVPESVINPLAGMENVKGADRDKVFFETMRKNAEMKKKQEEEAKRVKLAGMTDEEREEYEKEQAQEAKREARKNRMLSTQLTSYGNSAAASALRGGRGRGRGRGRGGSNT